MCNDLLERDLCFFFFGVSWKLVFAASRIFVAYFFADDVVQGRSYQLSELQHRGAEKGRL